MSEWQLSVQIYQDSVDELQKAANNAQAMFDVIATMAIFHTDWRYLDVSGDKLTTKGNIEQLKGLPVPSTMVLIDWPTREDLVLKINDWNAAMQAAHDAFDRVPVEHRTALTPPHVYSGPPQEELP